MGIYYCAECNEQLCGETFGCEVCATAQGDGVVYCEECARSATCSACEQTCCVRCACARLDCCGQVLCGAGKADAYATPEALLKAYGVTRDACFWAHTLSDEPWPGCGHPRCSGQPDACMTCAAAAKTRLEAQRVAADTVKAQALIDADDTSASLKAVLRHWVANTDFLAAVADAAEQAEQRLRDHKRERRGR
jgi:hypothetical protein